LRCPYLAALAFGEEAPGVLDREELSARLKARRGRLNKPANTGRRY